MNCPICTQALEGGELVMVCTDCHKRVGGGLSVNSTGEFRVPTSEQLESIEATGERVRATNVCAWCGKHERQVKKLLGRGGVALCDECIALCCDILDAELGTGWR
ncbi:MAG TPA: ClpX C4-type zinc finger protein [Kofleriaceae bacterium]|nr:ClpX C4-type zinc finger protein [Kofleriaceae bacterium]